MILPIWYRLRNIAESNPYTWYFVWGLIHRSSFFLPHDKSYWAIRHFQLAPGDLILDVGANDGISALSFFAINQHLNVFSIEPNRLHEKALEKLKKRYPSFDYRLVGAGKERGDLTLYSPWYHSILLHTFASSRETQVRRAVIESFGENVENNIEIISTNCEIIPLDELALAPKVIKIDVEGFEYAV
ncbi:MAG: FkbM family methyltransferase, partial [Anaerolineaceae bacterium]